MKSRKRKSDLTASSNVLQNLLQDGKSDLSTQFQRWKLWARWGDVVGETISQQCQPVWYSKGTLYVWVKNSSWMQQLIFMTDDMRHKINKVAGAKWVKKIRFTTDRHSVPMNGEESEDLKQILSRG